MKKDYLTFGLVIAALIIGGVFISAIAQMQHNIPISFYGKVIDQNSQPVAGVTVKLLVVADPSQNDLSEENAYTLETDQEGIFQLRGALGFSLQLTSIAKPGYELSKRAKLGYAYILSSDIYHPDPKAPVIFKMWKLVGKEPLTGSRWHGKMACDGATKRFDLHTGKPAENGALEMTCSRVPVATVPHGRGHFEYTFTITVLGGGIQPTDDEFTYRAPDAGYVPSFTIQQKPDDPVWHPNLTHEFYIKTPEGHYGRLYVDWEAWQTPPTYLEWNYSINPSGARNLER